VDQRTAGVAVAGGDATGGLDADVGAGNQAEVPGGAAAVVHDGNHGVLQDIGGSGSSCGENKGREVHNYFTPWEIKGCLFKTI